MEYELKRVIRERRNLALFLFLLALTAVLSFGTVLSERFVTKEGKAVSGMSAIRGKREQAKQWEGVLDAGRVREICEYYKQASNQDRADDLGYTRAEGLEDVADLMRKVYAEDGSYDYYVVWNLQDKQYGQFAERMNDGYQKSREESGLRQTDGKGAVQLDIRYARGWMKLLDDSEAFPLLVIAVAIMLGICIPPILEDEFRCRMAPIVYMTKQGRKKAVRNKICIIQSYSIFCALAILLLLAGILLACYGADGGGAAIQTDARTLWSLYHLTFLGEFALVMLGTLVGILFVVNLATLLLGLTRSAAVAAITPFVIAYCIPALKANVPGMAKMLLLPDGLLHLGRLLRRMQFVGLGSLRIPQAYALILLYLPVNVLLILGTYQLYRKRVV